MTPFIPSFPFSQKHSDPSIDYSIKFSLSGVKVFFSQLWLKSILEWKRLSESEKAPYIAKAEERKRDYQKSVEAYNSKELQGFKRSQLFVVLNKLAVMRTRRNLTSQNLRFMMMTRTKMEVKSGNSKLSKDRRLSLAILEATISFFFLSNDHIPIIVSEINYRLIGTHMMEL